MRLSPDPVSHIYRRLSFDLHPYLQINFLVDEAIDPAH